MTTHGSDWVSAPPTHAPTRARHSDTSSRNLANSFFEPTNPHNPTAAEVKPYAASLHAQKHYFITPVAGRGYALDAASRVALDARDRILYRNANGRKNHSFGTVGPTETDARSGPATARQPATLDILKPYSYGAPLSTACQRPLAGRGTTTDYLRRAHAEGTREGDRAYGRTIPAKAADRQGPATARASACPIKPNYDWHSAQSYARPLAGRASSSRLGDSVRV